MTKALQTKLKNTHFPVIIERDADGLYTIECPVLSGCYTQGKTVDEALKNIQEVIELCLEEKENRDVLESYNPESLSFHTVVITMHPPLKKRK